MQTLHGDMEQPWNAGTLYFFLGRVSISVCEGICDLGARRCLLHPFLGLPALTLRVAGRSSS